MSRNGLLFYFSNFRVVISFVFFFMALLFCYSVTFECIRINVDVKKQSASIEVLMPDHV